MAAVTSGKGRRFLSVDRLSHRAPSTENVANESRPTPPSGVLESAIEKIIQFLQADAVNLVNLSSVFEEHERRSGSAAGLPIEVLTSQFGALGAVLTREEASAFHAHFDSDHNGMLSFDEFAEVIELASKARAELGVWLLTAQPAAATLGRFVRRKLARRGARRGRRLLAAALGAQRCWRAHRRRRRAREVAAAACRARAFGLERAVLRVAAGRLRAARLKLALVVWAGAVGAKTGRARRLSAREGEEEEEEVEGEEWDEEEEGEEVEEEVACRQGPP